MRWVVLAVVIAAVVSDALRSRCSKPITKPHIQSHGQLWYLAKSVETTARVRQKRSPVGGEGLASTMQPLQKPRCMLL